ncbi:MAG: outer membrane beta-barrel protein [Alphaproteobacteria bacterium]|nr:outer membrane beta-barrel protein [Alphaproteobacteria bacterium]
MKKLLLSTTMLVLAAAVAPIAAQAQAPAPQTNVAVLDRARPDYDARGIRAGGFLIRPRIDLGVETTDNVFATERNETDDVIYGARTQVDVDSQWSRHGLRLSAGTDTVKYQDVSSEDRTNYNISADGRLDVRRDAYVGVRASYEDYKEARTAIDARATALEPTTIKVGRAAVYGAVALNRVRFLGSVERVDLTAKDVPLPGGGVLVQSTRDRKETYGTLRAEYALSPDTRLFAEAIANERKYDRRPASPAADRDSTGQTYLVGASTSLTRVLSGEAAVGYFRQDYDSPVVGAVDGLGVRGRIQWFPTQLTTVTLNASRQAQETDLGLVGSAVSTNAGVQVDHELRRNVILTGRLASGKYDFRGFDREDERLEAGVAATYLVNRNASVSATYSYLDGQSSGAQRDRDFTINRFGIVLQLKI